MYPVLIGLVEQCLHEVVSDIMAYAFWVLNLSIVVYKPSQRSIFLIKESWFLHQL
jgi:hypothetical protein